MAAADTSAGYEGQVRVGAPLGQRAVVKPGVVAAGGDAGSDARRGYRRTRPREYGLARSSRARCPRYKGRRLPRGEGRRGRSPLGSPVNPRDLLTSPSWPGRQLLGKPAGVYIRMTSTSLLPAQQISRGLMQ
jgi:hypothetical protein